MSPEWSAQDAILLAWPDEKTDWAECLAAIRQTYAEIIHAICEQQSVVLLVHSEAQIPEVQSQLSARLADPQRLVIIVVDYNDTWLRDSGPINLQQDGNATYLDYRFNGWGNKFQARLDDQICQCLFALSEFQHNPLLRSELIIEGGSIDTDGKGTLLTTESCLLTDTRNPSLSKDDYERHFHELLGIEQVIWLAHGELAGDDTDGHIDMLARFCDEKTIVYTSCEDPQDEHYAELGRMEQELKQKAAQYNLVSLPIPRAIYNDDDERLPASYCNFLIINNAVLVPVYDDPNDQLACERLQLIFSDRRIVPVNAVNIIQQGGSLHCLTMQLNKGFLAE